MFVNDIKRRLFEENQLRIEKCLSLISEEQLWYKHNKHVNSIGNLILHLCGNVRQYICSGIFREKDLRTRDLEFSQSRTYTKDQLLNLLNETMSAIREKIDLTTPEMLLNEYSVQGFEEKGIAILIHITEHFSYHVGQITYLTKYLNNVDTGYYAGKDLNMKSS